MLTKRIIPCLDIKDGKTVKGICFEQLKYAGDPVQLATYYVEEGADELVFLDISATSEKRKTAHELVKKIAQKLWIPFTIGGGIGSVKDVEILLNAGADKISVNTAAFKKPKFLDELVKIFGSQCIVLSIDTRQIHDEWWVYLNGGRIKTNVKAIDWAKEAVSRGVGEILLTSMNHDGTKNGFAVDLTREFSSKFSIPIIASGGAGKLEDFYNIFVQGKADAALAASIFHYKEIKIPRLKNYLNERKLPIHMTKSKHM